MTIAVDLGRKATKTNKQIPYFCRKLGKMSQNLSSGVVIGALRFNSFLLDTLHTFLSSDDFFFKINLSNKSFRNTIKV